jgi:3-isopropylmalate dehydrogenase
MPSSVTDGPKVSTTDYDLGARRWHATGETLPDSVLEELKGHDAILLGAIGDPTVPSGVLERGVLLPLRFALDHYVNLRPAKSLPGRRQPAGRRQGRPERHRLRRGARGHRGPVCRQRRRSLRTGTPHEIATEVSVNTRFGVERVVRDAFARAQARPRKHLTLVHKHNVLTFAGAPVAPHRRGGRAEFPEVQTAYQHVDAATIFLATDPGRFDVIVTDNLFGDIITDIAAAIAGGIGLAASGNINPRAAPPRACSSRCTGRRPTSPARARPTRPRRSCRWRCCWTTSGSRPTPLPGSRRPWPPTSPSAGPQPRSTTPGRRRDRRPVTRFGHE